MAATSAERDLPPRDHDGRPSRYCRRSCAPLRMAESARLAGLASNSARRCRKKAAAAVGAVFGLGVAHAGTRSAWALDRSTSGASGNR